MSNNSSIEQWKPVVGYEGLYEISNRGRVLSLRSGRVLKVWKHYRGGLRITLSKDGVQKMRQIHRMVYESFVGEIPEGYVIRHLNDDSEDNRVENLASGTYVDNSQDMIRVSGHYQSKVENCPRSHPLGEGNLVAGQLKRGHRSCLACDRARVRVKRNPDLGTWQEESDMLFQKLFDDGKISNAVYLSWGKAKM